MRRLIVILSLPIVSLVCIAEINPDSEKKEYKFSNPILAGFYPDPSICRAGNDYYLVNSTFSYFPGITIFRSKDLVSWELEGHVLDRPEQLNLEGQGVSRGLFAPTIRFHHGVFYVTCTLVDIGGNFIVTSKDPKGPWSNPVWLPQINGIDPSLFFDEEPSGVNGPGRAYLLYNSIAPENKPMYDGHRTIRMVEFDIQRLCVIGEEKILINGGTDISKKPIWIEGPHIFKKDGYYFLIAAEGGTADQHSEVVFRSRDVWGPYDSYQKNPIITQRHLNPKRRYAITCTGHADFVQTHSGDWWAVFLGCRPYPPVEEGYYNTGRETFLAPVQWNDGWPVINPGYDEVQYYYNDPIPSTEGAEKSRYSGNLTLRDEFDKEILDKNWIFLRTPKEQWYDLKEKPGFLNLNLRPETASGMSNPSFLGHRQQHLIGSASTALRFEPRGENEKAGLLIFQNEQHHYFLCKSIDKGKAAVQLYRSLPGTTSAKKIDLVHSLAIEENERTKDLLLKIEFDGSRYAFFYAFDPQEWKVLKDSLDGRFLSTRIAGGFVGAIFALYATSSGLPSKNTASFDWFEYKGNDAIYRQKDPGH